MASKSPVPSETSHDEKHPSQHPPSALDTVAALPAAAAPAKKRGFFSWRKKQDAANNDDVEGPGPGKASKVKAVSFFGLFRFATKLELTLNFIGLVCAAGAGVTPPLMSLLFGTLTQNFVDFQLVAIAADANPSNSTAQATLAIAGAEFRKLAAKNALYLVCVGLGEFLFTFFYMQIWVYTGEINAKRLRERYLQAILRQDIAYFDKIGAGEVATRIQSDTHLVQRGTSEKVVLLTADFSSFLAAFVIAYSRSWRLALALTSILPCMIISSAILDKFVSKYMQLSLGHVAAAGTVAEEVISTVRTAKAFGTQSILAGLYDKHVAKSRAVDLTSAFWSGTELSIFMFINYASYALTFSFGTTLINRGLADAGTVVSVFLAIIIGSFSLLSVEPLLQAVAHARGAAAKLYETIDRVPPIDSLSDEGLKPETCVGDISFENVNFNYPSRSDVPVIKNFSITFAAGRTAALVGASGSGKSTVISLVERFYDPLDGFVKLDGIDVKTLNVRWLRSQIGLVSQEPILFATTIRENVAHGLIGTPYELASEEEKFKLVKEACVKANADGFVSKLPEGYETLVGERGFLLSGGQKQRIAIARAIVSDPRILLLDEATSALDTQSEGVVQNALDKAAAGRTTITIAHRLSTIKDADCIYIMGEGVVLESGTHNELLSDVNSAYSRLVQAQKIRGDIGARTSRELGDDEEEISGDEITEKRALEREAAEEVPLGRSDTGRSLASHKIAQKPKQKEVEVAEKSYSMFYLFKRMIIINKDSSRQYVFGAMAAILTGTVWPAFGVIYSKSVDGLSISDPHKRRHEGDRNALWFFIFAILSAFLAGVRKYMFSTAASELTSKLRSLSFRAILRQDVKFFDKDENSTGQLTSNLSANPQKICGLAGATFGAIVQAISMLVTGSTLGLVFAWKLGLVGIACIPVLFSAGTIQLHVVILKDEKNKKAHDDSAQIACEAAASIKTVASLTREKDCLDYYSKVLETPLKRSIRSSFLSHGVYSLSQSMNLFATALVFWYGSQLVLSREVSMFQFFTALMCTTFGVAQAGNVFMFVPDISAARGAASDVVTLLDSMPDIDADATDGAIPKSVRGRMQLQDVHFRYPTRPGVRVLRGLNLTVEPGTYVALVGASGCGKSTIVQLIERFYDPLAGAVLLDGQPINELNVTEYRKHISLVSQEPTLYFGSIRFNVLLGATKPASEITQEEIEDACRNANILDFINSLPDGFETEVGGKGSQLSGGQKQRIAIARALLRNPKVLLLDEATSALDSNSEQVVQEALDRAARGRTTIAIAHRLSTIQNADCIYFIKDGQVSESGTHDQLLALRGGYYEHVQLQALSNQ